MTALPDDVRELLAAVVTALDVPLADRTEDDKARAELLSRRASDARIILAAAIKGDIVADCTRQLHSWIAEHPVTFVSWQDRSKEAQR
jgi:hypothetical protein